MKNVLLLSINARFSHANLALHYLRNELRAEGLEPIMLECEINQRRQEILQRISAHAPHVILISVYVWNALLVSLLLPDLRALLPGVRLVIGGPEVSWTAEEWLEHHPGIDVVISGPGEAAVRLLARNGFESPSRVLSAANPPFSEIPFPYTDEDFPRLHHRYVYYESSRGCPCSCSYCISGRADQRPDYRSAEQTIAELGIIIEQTRNFPAPPIVKLVDRTFNAQPARAREIWAFLAEADTDATFHCEIHPAFLQSEDLALLATAPPGRFQFEIGVQSVHADTLRAIGRSNQWGRSRPRVQELIALGNVTVHLDLIVGLPHDDVDSLTEAVDDLLRLKPHRIDLGTLKSLPGTAIRENAAHHGQIAMRHPPYQVLANNWLTPADFARFARIGELIDAIWNTSRLEQELDAAAFRHGGYGAALFALERHAADTGYHVATRQRQKVEAFLGSATS
ncbi:MAG: DUF4080 domain-containing protein [Spirochaetaceae bacterium]|nr:MAG: DUF4080 domain-containing protein [Spirochaetaceae bacterium]